ncbi:acyl carrier protein [Bordetella tumulicola]|uniref:acyl carrier protein n=1 Tax=Bordetella tumulicola TaxID=1649133 RepID=UPI0039EE5CCB
MDINTREQVERVVRMVAQEHGLEVTLISDDTAIVDELGFTSMMVATLIANLEEELGVDPFADEDVMITDVRTFGDLHSVYGRCLESAR